MNISLCLTNYNRTDLLLQSFEQVIDDPRIDEVVVADDCSNEETKSFLVSLANRYPFKFRWEQGDENIGMYRNKRRAIALARNESCILFDSDNILTPAYLDALDAELAESGSFFPDTIYCPAFAKPAFKYYKFTGDFLGLNDNKRQIQEYLKDQMFNTLLNTCNYFVNKTEYLKVWKSYPDNPAAADSITFMHDWFAAGNGILVVPGMEYEHRIHPGSGFLENVSQNTQLANKKFEQIKELFI